MELAKHRWLKIIAPTLAFYLICFLILSYLFKVSPSGPCVPGMGVMAFLLLVPVIAFLLLRNVFFAVKGSRTHLVRALLHALVCASIAVAAYF
jgi:hypothetical protein